MYEQLNIKRFVFLLEKIHCNLIIIIYEIGSCCLIFFFNVFMLHDLTVNIDKTVSRVKHKFF